MASVLVVQFFVVVVVVVQRDRREMGALGLRGGAVCCASSSEELVFFGCGRHRAAEGRLAFFGPTLLGHRKGLQKPDFQGVKREGKGKHKGW